MQWLTSEACAWIPRKILRFEKDVWSIKKEKIVTLQITNKDHIIMIDFDVEYCPHCGVEINYEANTCTECGGKMIEGGSFCPYCGADEPSLYCNNCGEEITEEDVERYNLLTDEEKIALHETYLQKKAEEDAEEEARREKLKEARKLSEERIAIEKAQETILINEVVEYIKSNVSFDCKLDVIISLTSIRIQARILDIAYTLTATFNKEDKAIALPKFTQTLIAVREVAGK